MLPEKTDVVVVRLARRASQRFCLNKKRNPWQKEQENISFPMATMWQIRYPELICVICQDDIKPRKNTACRPLSCKHFYHKTCLLDWFRHQTENSIETLCPYCRRPTSVVIALENNNNGKKSTKFYNSTGSIHNNRYILGKYTCKTCLIECFNEELTVCRQCLDPTHTFCFYQNSSRPVCNSCAPSPIPNNVGAEPAQVVTNSHQASRPSGTAPAQEIEQNDMAYVWPIQYPALECVICHEDIEPKQNSACRPLFCKHFYHKECLLKWFAIEAKNKQLTHCPYCRRVSYKIVSLENNADGKKVMQFYKPSGSACKSQFQIEEDTCATCLIGTFDEDLTVCRQCLRPTHTFCLAQKLENSVNPETAEPAPIVAEEVSETSEDNRKNEPLKLVLIKIADASSKSGRAYAIKTGGSQAPKKAREG
ncbi:unnamed protein product [Caenorhabditis angaria]|uniref:RING-type domain-containing protein n=1 Tax=Caenorhabditis angaria TaxID=860376 RepID=A0A9P1IZU7_9PELO|nr:unnamed protein product [Caenorhabditis angaria]